MLCCCCDYRDGRGDGNKLKFEITPVTIITNKQKKTHTHTNVEQCHTQTAVINILENWVTWSRRWEDCTKSSKTSWNRWIL